MILEEGTPEQIFNSPLKEETREFIQHLQVFEATVTNDNLNIRNMMTQLERFGNRHMIDHHIVNRMLIVAEELCVDTILPLLKDDTGIQLRFEYSENDDSSISVRITYAGENTDPLEKANELSAVLISHVLSDISFSYDKGICLIDAKLVR